ncbi:MAG: zinc-dependent alcohol dehydrogenase family protein [Herminiimonas sp.]|nr:zinc-dependent alcohol dehydrogenase family protein [Herminiimonas sp.]
MGASLPYAQSKPLTVTQIDLAPPGRDEVLVKIVAAGLCHSDLSVINGDRPRPVPMALGHEAAGIVEALGEGVSDLQRGDHVVVVFVPSCGHCAPCAEGRPALCEPGAAANGAGTLLSGARRLSREGGPINHHLGCSVFAEYATVSRHSLVKIDPEVPLDEAALFGCAVLTGVGAVVNTAQVRVGASVAIIGLGGVGLAAVLGARAAGARQIIAIDRAGDKLEQALALGATHAVNASDPDALERIRTMSAGGVEYAFEFAGAIAALELAYRVTRRGGTTVTAGLPPSTASLLLPVVSLVAEERSLKGSYIGTCVPSRDIPHYMALYRQGRLPVDKLLTGRLPLEDINHGFDLLHEGKAIRQVVVF